MTMPDFSNASKQDIIRFLRSMPGAVAFDGWKDGQAKYTDQATLSTWSSAQKNPAYDEEVERELYKSFSQLGPSAQQGYLKSIDAAVPRLRFMQEMKESPVDSRGNLIKGKGR